MSVGGKLRVKDRVKDLVGHLDQLAGILGEIGVVGDDHGERLAGEANVAVGQRPQLADRCFEEHGGIERPLEHRGEIGGGEHGPNAGGLACRGDVKGGDPGSGDVAADERHVRHTGDDDVVEIDAVAGNQTRILPPLYRLTDPPAGGRRHGGGVDHAPSGHG